MGRWYRWRDCQVRLRLCLRPCVLGSVPPVITKKLLSGKLTGVRRNYQNILGATLLNWKKKKEKRKNRKKERRRKAWSNKPGRKKLSFFESVRDLLINLRYISFVHVVTGSSLSFDENQWTFLLFQFIAVMWFHSFYTDLWAPKWSRNLGACHTFSWTLSGSSLRVKKLAVSGRIERSAYFLVLAWWSF